MNTTEMQVHLMCSLHAHTKISLKVFKVTQNTSKNTIGFQRLLVNIMEVFDHYLENVFKILNLETFFFQTVNSWKHTRSI